MKQLMKGVHDRFEAFFVFCTKVSSALSSDIASIERSAAVTSFTWDPCVSNLPKFRLELVGPLGYHIMHVAFSAGHAISADKEITRMPE